MVLQYTCIKDHECLTVTEYSHLLSMSIFFWSFGEGICPLEGAACVVVLLDRFAILKVEYLKAPGLYLALVIWKGVFIKKINRCNTIDICLT